MKANTHLDIDPLLCGSPVFLDKGKCKVELATTTQMAVDEKGLVHGGFIFGLADYAAMLAVNDPNVVLGGASVKFVKPVKVGDALTGIAEISETDGKKNVVSVEVKREEETVFTGEFFCFVLPKHVLD